VLAALGFMPTRVTVINQGVEVGVGHGKHVTTSASVATIGAAKLFVFFMPERDAAVPAIARGDVNVGFVNKFHDRSGLYSSLLLNEELWNKKAPTRRGSLRNG
jgi:hypothetical protein